MAGSATGILLAFLLVKNIGDNGYKTVFAVSIIPIVMALFMFIFIHEKTEKREVAQREHLDTMLGLHSTLAGIALLPASVIAGLLWDNIGAFAPFVYGGSMSLISAVILISKLK